MRYALAFLLAITTTGQAETIAGQASVIDGDTLDVGGERVRLEGIDAPELAQTCGRAWIGTWRCGEAAARELQKLVAGPSVTCQVEGHDKYGRALGLCSADGRDVNATMVRSGFAWAFVKYSARYITEEASAKAEKIGIWSGTAVPAWEFRAHRWESVGLVSPNGCAIKGNISSNGRIYFMPWSEWYLRVKIDQAKGERWFCTEAEALAAGWRAPAFGSP